MIHDITTPELNSKQLSRNSKEKNTTATNGKDKALKQSSIHSIGKRRHLLRPWAIRAWRQYHYWYNHKNYFNKDINYESDLEEEFVEHVASTNTTTNNNSNRNTRKRQKLLHDNNEDTLPSLAMTTEIKSGDYPKRREPRYETSFSTSNNNNNSNKRRTSKKRKKSYCDMEPDITEATTGSDYESVAAIASTSKSTVNSAGVTAVRSKSPVINWEHILQAVEFQSTKQQPLQV